MAEEPDEISPGSGEAEEFRYPPEESFGHLVRIVGRAFVRSLQLRLERHDVTVGQWAFLRILWEHDGLTQRELAEMVGLMEPSAKFALNGLERRGLITPVRNAEDRRKRNFWITPEGHALKKVLLPYAKEVSDAALAGLEPEQAEQMTQAICHVIANLQTDIEQQQKLTAESKQHSAAARPKRRARRKPSSGGGPAA